MLNFFNRWLPTAAQGADNEKRFFSKVDEVISFRSVFGGLNKAGLSHLKNASVAATALRVSC